MRRPLALSAAVALALVALSGCAAIDDALNDEPERDESGTVTEASEEDVFALAVGDCLDSAALGAEIETVPFVPCDQAHDSEVYARTDLSGDAYPGEDVVAEKADTYCYGEFAAFVGMDYESSSLDFFTMYPIQEGWEQIDDREVLCLVVDPAGGVTGSMQGVAR